MILNRIYYKTLDYIKQVKKVERKKIGQFFTPPTVASYMAELMTYNQPNINILDTGAGTGILIGALCQKILNNDTITTIHVDLYENDENVLPALTENMILVKRELEKRGKTCSYNIIQENFILHNEDFWNDNLWYDNEDKTEENLYDVVISNPPYRKIKKSAPEALVMNYVVHGQPNIYFLFMALSTKLLKPNGQLIFITPRSFTSGAYFKKFRAYFLHNMQLTNLHLFHSRGDVFNSEKVLQEAIILKAVKTNDFFPTISVSSSENADLSSNFSYKVPYETVVDMKSEDLFIMIPTSIQEVELLDTVKKWESNLLRLGFKLKTGPVVDFRSTQFLKEENSEKTVPLIWASHFKNNEILFPRSPNKYPQYIENTDESKGLLLPNKDYILVKRFTSKEEKRRVQSSLYLSEALPFLKIGIENHLNYVTKLNGDIEKEELYGLFALLNSSFIDTYYRILNGSTQVNATEVNTIPLPSLEIVKEIGRKLIKTKNITTENCDSIIMELFVVNDANTTTAKVI
ncbi:Eco57I restriction-modification methylase domain-containing protein [Lentibacillus songyuanensis]|uniref:Eco57I restriction-modification methylase domain-containing protein n=1 Tax=Lentibacillus songyuanensis TaxID=3136161 RepID=UPI0031BA9EB6